MLTELITDHYYPAGSGGKLDLTLVRATIPSWGDARDEDLADGFNDALATFHGSRQRSFLRGAVENAQRRALAGHRPVAVVIENDGTMLRSWRSYLGQRLGGRFVDMVKRRWDQMATEHGYHQETPDGDDNLDHTPWNGAGDDPDESDPW